jgi:glucans biosynthesis protein
LLLRRQQCFCRASCAFFALVAGAFYADAAPSTGKPAPERFSFETVVSEAKALAASPYFQDMERVPRFYLELSNEVEKQIQFRPEKSIWLGTDSPWRLRLLHPGPLYNRIVRLFTVEGGVVQEVRYDRGRFTFGAEASHAAEHPGGHAGFFLSGAGGDFAMFAGGTQFRCLPTGVRAAWGMRARGVAVNAAVPGRTEDFPYFKKYWIERGSAGMSGAVVFALMDSPFVSGACRFEIIPGQRTVVGVQTVLFVREKVDSLGLAPLSAMFWYGENSLDKPQDFRPEVHNADGLLVRDADGRVRWRPLARRMTPHRSACSTGALSGFGLRQRDTAFDNYQDLDNPYHRCPGVWVEPLGNWPEGKLYLTEQPTSQENWENVACYWQPAVVPAPGGSLHLRYRITWAMEGNFSDTLARVTSTHAGRKADMPRVLKYLVDFSSIPGETPDAKVPPQVNVFLSGPARLEGQRLVFNTETQGWRLSLEIEPEYPAAIYNAKAVLLRDGREVSENWDYVSE